MNAKDEIDLPLQTRADVRLQPDTVNAEDRTVEVVWSTEAPVRRRDPWTGKSYDEVLSLDPSHVDLSRLNAGAPLLDTHGAAPIFVSAASSASRSATRDRALVGVGAAFLA